MTRLNARTVRAPREGARRWTLFADRMERAGLPGVADRCREAARLLVEAAEGVEFAVFKGSTTDDSSGEAPAGSEKAGSTTASARAALARRPHRAPSRR
jgi:hypothetical protein